MIRLVSLRKFTDSGLGVTGCRCSSSHPWSASVRTRGSTTSHWHSDILADSMGLKGPVLGRDAIHMNGAIAALRRYKFVHGVPGNALDVMVVFG